MIIVASVIYMIIDGIFLPLSIIDIWIFSEE